MRQADFQRGGLWVTEIGKYAARWQEILSLLYSACLLALCRDLGYFSAKRIASCQILHLSSNDSRALAGLVEGSRASFIRRRSFSGNT